MALEQFTRILLDPFSLIYDFDIYLLHEVHTRIVFRFYVKCSVSEDVLFFDLRYIEVVSFRITQILDQGKVMSIIFK